MDDRDPPFGSYQAAPLQSWLIALGRSLRANRLGKRTASVIRSSLRRMRSEPLDLEVLGQRMRLHAGNNACEKRLIVTPQFFDPIEADVESYEDQVLIPYLSNMPPVLHPKAIIMELNAQGWKSDLTAFLKESSYSQIGPKGHNGMLVRNVP